MTWDYEYDVVVVGSGAALVADNIKEIYLKKGIQAQLRTAYEIFLCKKLL